MNVLKSNLLFALRTQTIVYEKTKDDLINRYPVSYSQNNYMVSFSGKGTIKKGDKKCKKSKTSTTL